MLRHDCPYTPEGNPRGKTRLSPEEYKRVLPDIFRNLLARPSVPPHFTYATFFKTLKKLDPEHAWTLKTNAVGTSAKLYRKKRHWLVRMFT